MSTWDLWELRGYFPRSGHQRVHRVIDSIGRCTMLLDYHVFFARDAFEGIIVDPHDTITNARYAIGDGPNQQSYNAAFTASEAHIIAAVNMVRAFADIFAFLVNLTILDSAFTERNCSFQALPKKMASSPLRDSILGVQARSAFKYVQAFSNSSKHRQLVLHGFMVPFDAPAGIRLFGFRHDGEQFPERTITEVLEDVLELKNAIKDCGRAYNQSIMSG